MSASGLLKGWKPGFLTTCRALGATGVAIMKSQSRYLAGRGLRIRLEEARLRAEGQRKYVVFALHSEVCIHGCVISKWRCEIVVGNLESDPSKHSSSKTVRRLRMQPVRRISAGWSGAFNHS